MVTVGHKTLNTLREHNYYYCGSQNTEGTAVSMIMVTGCHNTLNTLCEYNYDF